MNNKTSKGDEMSDTKFTPRPWEAVIYGGKATTQFSIMDDTNEPICSESYAIRPTSEIEANAHLIAAAPDMYKALKRSLASIDNLYSDVGLEREMREAIAKAEGKSND